MVAQLLREFVAGPWLDELDLDAMERMNAKFHAETTDRRDGDMIWRIPRRGGGDTYLVLLLEFQSTQGNRISKLSQDPSQESVAPCGSPEFFGQ